MCFNSFYFEFMRVSIADGGMKAGPQSAAAPIAGGDGSRLPTANELEGARYQGRKIAETANKLHG